MALEVIISSIIYALSVFFGPLILTLRVYKDYFNKNTYAITQRVNLILQLIFVILAIGSISYQLFVKKKIYYESVTYIDLISYIFALLFVIINIIYFKYVIIDYETQVLKCNK